MLANFSPTSKNPLIGNHAEKLNRGGEGEVNTGFFDGALRGVCARGRGRRKSLAGDAYNPKHLGKVPLPLAHALTLFVERLSRFAPPKTCPLSVPSFAPARTHARLCLHPLPLPLPWRAHHTLITTGFIYTKVENAILPLSWVVVVVVELGASVSLHLGLGEAGFMVITHVHGESSCISGVSSCFVSLWCSLVLLWDFFWFWVIWE